MDRYVTREPRVGAEYPQRSNHPIEYRVNAIRNNPAMIPENMYYGGYGLESPFCGDGYIAVQQRMNPAAFSPVNRHPSQGQMLSGINPQYLAAYSDNNASFIVSGQQMQDESPRLPMNFGNDYENRSLVAPDRSKINVLVPQAPQEIVKQSEGIHSNKFLENPFRSKAHNNQFKENFRQVVQQNRSNVSSNITPTENPPRDDTQAHVLTRSEKIKVLNKSGPRAFSGPIEKVLKWHKALQEIGILIIYEIVAKCVSVRPGDSCSKNLVVRDDNGPAMQVVYYEIDFLLPELKPPCTVRVVGRMLAGTCRLQAFNVRLATGDDVATLPRRAAVAAHHVAKMCKEYGVNFN